MNGASRASGHQPAAEAGDIGIAVVDDDAIVRDWIRSSLHETEFRVVGEAATAQEARVLLARRRPAVLILDFRLPDLKATEFLRLLRREGVETPVLIMTATPTPGLNETAREAGADGLVLKRADPGALVRALRNVVAGEVVADEEHPRRRPGEKPLSARERELLRLAAGGATNRELAEALGIGAETVKTLLSRVYGKLGARNRTEAVTLARDRGQL